MDAFRKFLLSKIPLAASAAGAGLTKQSKNFSFKVFQPRKVKVLVTPCEFYDELCDQILKTQRKVSIASLYLGTGDKEKQLQECLCKLVESNSKVQVRVLVDKNRGTRPDPVTGSSTASMCTALLHSATQHNVDAHQNVNVNFFKMPRGPKASRLRVFVESYMPPRFNEMFQTFHMKAYVFDDKVILTGANLSTDYFTNRQDRYVVIECSALAKFYHELIDILGKYSYTLQSPITPNFEENNLTTAESARPPLFSLHSSKALEENSKGLACELENLMTRNTASDVDRIELTTATTICAPTIQFKALGIDYDEKVTSSFLSSVLSAGDQINVASGYLNFTDNYTKLMAENKALTRVMTASPKANGFYTANGISGSLPLAYSLLQQRFMETFNTLRASMRMDGEVEPEDLYMYEYMREGWTFHGKGMWYIPGAKIEANSGHDDESSVQYPTGTVVGSSNFGWRSVIRDAETQVYLHTIDKNLQRSLHKEWEEMEKYTANVHADTFKFAGRYTQDFLSWKYGHWINIGSRLARTFM